MGYTFITRAEKRENAPEFTPKIFIDDYRQKFVNASGSSFNLIKGSETPDRIDRDIKYYEVEYVVRTQLGFGFDSLKSLHFLTAFAAAVFGCWGGFRTDFHMFSARVRRVEESRT